MCKKAMGLSTVGTLSWLYWLYWTTGSRFQSAHWYEPAEREMADF